MVNKLFITILILCITGFMQFQTNVRHKKPVIGVYTQPAHFGTYWNDEYQYILQNNVQFIEEAGGEVVAIPYNGTDDQLVQLFNGINGLFFTGGGMNLNWDVPIANTTQEYNIFLRNAGFLIDLAKQANDNGDFFPIWGTCQGFEILNIVQTDNTHDILSNIDNNEDFHRAGIFSQKSRLFQEMDDDLLQYALSNNILYYYHEWAVYPSDYKVYQSLDSFYEIVGYSTNGQTLYKGIPFVAAIESFQYPFYGVQFHPEITLYDNNKNTNKSEKSLEFNAYFGPFFIEQARKNTHKYDLKNPLLSAATFKNFQLVEFPDDFFQYIYFIENSLFDDNL